MTFDVTGRAHTSRMAVEYTKVILEHAAQTGGICTRQGLLVTGISGRVIDGRLRSGLLVPVRAGVYLVPALEGPLTSLYRATMSVPGSVVSRRSAADGLSFEHGLAGVGGNGLVHITAAHGASRTLAGVVVHETRLLREADIGELAPRLPATSPARTVVDLAGEHSSRRLRHLAQVQVGAGRPTAVELHACFEALRRRGVPGVKLLDRLLNELFAVAPIGLSELEKRVMMALQAADVRGFEPQFKPPWYDGRRGIVDFANHALRIVLEADGRCWHDTTQATEDDHRRDRLAASHGWVTIRVGWSEIVDRPNSTMDDIAAVVEQRRTGRAA